MVVLLETAGSNHIHRIPGLLHAIFDAGHRPSFRRNRETAIVQVDLKQCYLLGVIGKRRRPRDVPFCDDVRKVLLKYLKRGTAGDSVICYGGRHAVKRQNVSRNIEIVRQIGYSGRMGESSHSAAYICPNVSVVFLRASE